MRLLALTVVLSVGEAHAESEHYEQIRVDAGFTVSRVAIEGRSGGGLLAEVKAMVHDNIAVGGRVDLTLLFGGVLGQDELELGFTMAGAALVKGEYLVGTAWARPFVGLGVGGYSIGSQSIEDGPNTRVNTTVGRYFGFAPQIGVDLGPVRFAVSYNVIVGADIEYTNGMDTTARTERASQNYWALEGTYRFGGGPKPVARPLPAGPASRAPATTR
jgi:hypothetical protein